ncbi:ATP synthase F0 subunit C [Helcococcus bovis]
MKKSNKLAALLLAVMVVSSFMFFGGVASAANNEQVPNTSLVESSQVYGSIGSKALAAGVAIGLACLGGGIGMGLAIAKSADGISRQPEAEGKIRSALMIGLVFVETVVIYALIVSILVIFVL